MEWVIKQLDFYKSYWMIWKGYDQKVLSPISNLSSLKTLTDNRKLIIEFF